MDNYNPMIAPDPTAWLDLPEQDRLDLALEAHADVAKRLPNPKIHAVMHVLVENQVAMREEPEVACALERLVREGLDRHEAIHAIASTCLEDLFTALRNKTVFSMEKYTKKISELSAESWLKNGDAGD